MDSHTRRLIYPLWLRFFALVAGAALVILLVGPSLLFSNSDPTLPWNEEARIIPPGQTSEARPSADQPQLTRVLRYKAQAEQDGSPRGVINLLIYPDGVIKGVWNGEYDQPNDTHCLIMAASFTGNIDPSKPFLQNGARNISKLYFITSGTFTLLETQLSTGQTRSVNGFVYVRGWLDPDYVAIGDIIITENKKSLENFSWAARPAN
jgi:hypothetical protein